MLGLVYPRIHLGRSRVRVISWVAAVAATLAVLVGGSVFVARHGGPVGFVDQRVKEFGKVGYPDLRSQGIRFGTNVGSNRHDFWRVGMNEAVDRPLIGGGAGSFQFVYLEHRRSGESPRDPHSLIVRVASELGLPGLVLLIAFVVGCVGGAIRSRGQGRTEAALVAASVAGGVQWFVQGSYDWFWQYPGVSAPAFYLLGLAVARRSPGRRAASRSAPARWALAGALVAAALVAMPLFVSDRYVQRGIAEARDDPGAALRDLKRASELNPLSEQPLIDRGALAASLGEHALALESFRDAIERVPDNYALALVHRPGAAAVESAGGQGRHWPVPSSSTRTGPRCWRSSAAWEPLRRTPEGDPGCTRRGSLPHCSLTARPPAGGCVVGSEMTALTEKISLTARSAWIAAFGAVLALLVWAAGAFAASDPTQEQYRNITQISHGGGGASGLEKTVVSGLPFTGLDLIALLAVAVLLTSMGFALRRLTLDRGPRA